MAFIEAFKTAKSVYSTATFLNAQLEKYKDEKTQEFFNAIIKNFRDGALSMEEFEDMLNRCLNSSLEKRDRLLKLLLFSYRSLLDSVDDRVLPALARLTALYLEKLSDENLLHAQVAVDSFYRGSCRLLSDLSGDEFEELKLLAKYIKDAPDDTTELYVDYMIEESRGRNDAKRSGNDYLLNVWMHFCKKRSVLQTINHSGQFQHIERLAELFIRNGFEASAWVRRASQGAHGIILGRLDFPLVRRLSLIVLP